MDTSGYVPLSLADTITKANRSYRSNKTATTSSRPAPRPSHAGAGSFNAKERADAARREAAAMIDTLGLASTPSSSSLAADVEATPRPDRSLNSTAMRGGGVGAAGTGLSLEVVALKAQLGDKDDELSSLRREFVILQREKKDLAVQVAKLETEKREGGGNAGLDAKQLEELEKQFESQELLLGGYQREAEKAAQELDTLRNRQRRMTEWFERTYGSDWADDLGLTDKPQSGSSPIARTKLVARASLAGTGVSSSSASVPSLSRLNTDSSSVSSSSIFETPAQSSPRMLDAQPSPSHSPSPATTSLSPALASSAGFDPVASAGLKQHLESVQALLRSMEARLIARDVEVAKIEKRARDEKEVAREKQVELEKVVDKFKGELQGQGNA
ncbi:hypothetical protein JCM11641_000523 [Rhodosporidiobolus odoratus]